jgi:hypothetical protein
VNAAGWIAHLGLAPHPEGGHYREVFRDRAPDGGRGRMAVIYFLLEGGRISAWHRLDAVESWHYHTGAPLVLHVAGGAAVRLGADAAAGEAPQAVVPAGAWQRAASLGAFTLVSCVTAPAFEFGGFEIAAPGQDPAVNPS